MNLAVPCQRLTMSDGATMEDAVMGDSTATLVLHVSEGEQLAGSHHRPVTALPGERPY